MVGFEESKNKPTNKNQKIKGLTMRRERNLSPGGLVCISGWLFDNVTEGGLAPVMEIATTTQECCNRKLDKSSYSFRPSPVTFFVSKALMPKACSTLSPNNLTNWGPSFQYISLWGPFFISGEKGQ